MVYEIDGTVCPTCQGTGSIPIVTDGSAPPVFARCKCALRREILLNTERGYGGLTDQPAVQGTSPLLKYLKKNLWVTAPKEWFLPHLRHVAIRQPPNWAFQVVSDAQMMTAWLANTAIAGVEILDADVRDEAAAVSLQKLTLVDLVQPPTLMISRLGVKSARNSAMSEVFLEALTLREDAGKPTWIWDTPDQPLSEGHLCYSKAVVDYIHNWDRLDSRDIDTKAKVDKAVALATKKGAQKDPKMDIRNLLLRGGSSKSAI